MLSSPAAANSSIRRRIFASSLTALLGAISLVAVAAPALADDSAPDQQGDGTPTVVLSEEVDVEAKAPKPPALAGIERRLPMDADETPASLSSVSDPLLADRGAVSLSDALYAIAGVNVQTGSGVFDQWNMRGFDGVSSTLVLSDGSVEPESTMMHLYNVDRVEVLRGGGGFLYGGRALAGTINLVRKRPAGGDFVHFGLTGGSHGFLEGTVDANWQVDETSGFRLNAMWRSADNFRDDNEMDALAFNPSWAWRDDDTTIGVHLEYVSNEITPDSGIPIVSGALADVPRERSYSSPFDRSEQDVVRFQVNIEQALSDSLDWRTKVYYNSIDWQSDGTLIVGALDFGFTAFAARALSTLDDKQDFYGIQSELSWTAQTGSVRHEILTGVEIARQNDDFYLNVFNLPAIDVYQPVESAQQPLFPFPGQERFGDVTSEIIAPFFFDRMVFSDTFQLILGARWDTIEMDASGTASARDDDQVSPFLGFVVSPNDSVSFYANYAESFEPQSTLVVGSLDPEEGEQIEAGVKLSLADGKVRLDLAWFDLEKTNLAIPDFTGFPGQTGSQASDGVELELAAALGNGFDLRVAFAHTEAEFTEFREFVVFGPGPTDFFVADRAGNTPAFAPENLADLWLSKRFDNGFGFGVGTRWVDEQFIAPDNGFVLDDYNLLDAAVFYSVGQVQLHLNLYNLTDEDYATRTFSTGAVAPAPGFEARLGVRYLM